MLQKSLLPIKSAPLIFSISFNTSAPALTGAAEGAKQGARRPALLPRLISGVVFLDHPSGVTVERLRTKQQMEKAEPQRLISDGEEHVDKRTEGGSL